MEIDYGSNRMERLIESDKKLLGKFGNKNAQTIRQRTDLLKSVGNLAEISTMGSVNCHPLAGGLKEHFSIGIDGGLRLIYKIGNDPVPLFEKGGIDYSSVTRIIIVDIVNYH